MVLTKILFIGPMGAGKTTAIGTISDCPPVSTEARNLDQQASAKATTTVAMDYGEIDLEESGLVALYGIPGQQRFDFMWPILAQGALGAVLLLDHRRTEALEDLGLYLDTFMDLAKQGAVVIGLGWAKSAEDLISYREKMRAVGLVLPIFAVDARERDSVLLLVDTLVAAAEIREQGNF